MPDFMDPHPQATALQDLRERNGQLRNEVEDLKEALDQERQMRSDLASWHSNLIAAHVELCRHLGVKG